MKTKCVSNNTNKFTIGGFYDVVRVGEKDFIAADDKGRARPCMPIHGGTFYRATFAADRGAVFQVLKPQSEIDEAKKPWYRRKENIVPAIFTAVILLVATVAYVA